MGLITCFIPYSDNVSDLIATLKTHQSVAKVIVLCMDGKQLVDSETLQGNFQQSSCIKAIAKASNTPYTLFFTKAVGLHLGTFALDRMLQVIKDTSAGMLYSDCFKIKEGVRTNHPVIDYQVGSLRDDFDFGSLLLFKTEVLKTAAAGIDTDYQFAGWYDLRLRISQKSLLYRLPEYLYTEVETDCRKSGEKIFDYVDPKNRAVQIEMEQACTAHLKAVGAYLKPEFISVQFDKGTFPVEASVLIPVYNRVKTIEDAVQSVLSQKTDFAFNLIVVDNHSTDGTTAILERLAVQDPRIIHYIPTVTDLGIGGCWNAGIMHPQCGKFAIQLDSDDLYSHDQVIASVVAAFYEQNCAMLVGSYQMVNFKLEEIPPGLIDHKEWTPDNGRNNALRINGLGAPRAFYTPVLRDIKIPNTSYGEDYAVGLSISRNYQIGRIYQSLYLCRRWDDNSDASLDIVKMNTHNIYKDRIRSIELLARINKVKGDK